MKLPQLLFWPVLAAVHARTAGTAGFRAGKSRGLQTSQFTRQECLVTCRQMSALPAANNAPVHDVAGLRLRSGLAPTAQTTKMAAIDRMRTPHLSSVRCEICILAGGLSSRMGRDKSRLRLGGRGLLAHVRATAERLGLPVRVVRRDVVPRCGPLGGVYTALTSTRASVVLFLSCDMPFVSARLLRTVLGRRKPKAAGRFVAEDKIVGFPFVLKVETLLQITQLQAQKRFSLQHLARALAAELIYPKLSHPAELFNVNTPNEWAQARQIWKSLHRDKVKSHPARHGESRKDKADG